MQSRIIQGILVASSLSMVACFQSESPTSGAAPREQGVNNSDPSKASYRPMTDQEKVRRQKKLDMLAKIDPAWAGHLASAPAAKTAASAVVGFLEKTTATPYVDIYMDTENTGNGDLLLTQGSSANQLSITGIDRLPQPDHNGGMLFHVKQKTMSTLPRLQWDYVSFLFSDNCPTNGYRFSQVFDNEDTQNQDYASGSVYPGWSRRDWTGTMLKFCFVPGTGSYTATQPPWWNTASSGASGAIAAPNKTFYDYTSTVYPFKRTVNCNITEEALLDGEDDGWAGYIDYEQVPTQYRANLDAIMDIRWGAPHFYINKCPHGIPVGI